MAGIGGGNFIDAAAVMVDVLRCRDSRLERVLIPNTVRTAKGIDLVFV